MRERLGVGSPFAVAAADACIHLLTLNPLWVVTTFIVDSIWGLTYHFTRDLSSSMTSHFVWDAAIFILFPIR
jgi:membrane protease YdiL (CAAX protease family)